MKSDGADDLQHTSGHPTGAPTKDRPRQVPRVQSQAHRVGTAYVSRIAWLHSHLGPGRRGREDGGHSHATKGQIDIKAPPPRHVRGESTANQRTYHDSDSHHGTHEALYFRPLSQRNSVYNGHNLRTRVNSCDKTSSEEQK